jgi:hypothetical protein
MYNLLGVKIKKKRDGGGVEGGWVATLSVGASACTSTVRTAEGGDRREWTAAGFLLLPASLINKNTIHPREEFDQENTNNQGLV